MSPAEEHLATRAHAGLFDFSFMGLYEFSSLEEMQKAQTRNVEALEPGQAAYTLVLNEDGSVFNDATVWRLGADRFWLFTGRPRDFARFAAVARDLSGEHAILALQGPQSGRILAKLIGEDAVLALRYFRFTETNSILVARLGYSGELGYELLVPAARGPELRRALAHAGREHGLRECSFEAANSLRIESGYVLFDREIDGGANPRDLGLERLVSDKGRSFEMKKKLVGLEIVDGQARDDLPHARVTSQCYSPTLGKGIALGFAPPEVRPGDFVRLDDAYLARVATLPFYDPARRLPRARPV